MFESAITLAQASAIEQHEYDRCDDGCFDTSTSHDEVEQMHNFEAEDLELAQTGLATYEGLDDMFEAAKVLA